MEIDHFHSGAHLCIIKYFLTKLNEKERKISNLEQIREIGL